MCVSVLGHSVLSDSSWPHKLWIVTGQAPLSTGFPRQEYWSGVPLPIPVYLPNTGIEPMPLVSPALACMLPKSLQSCPTLYNPMDYSPPGYSVHGDSPGKNIGMGCSVLLQWIFLTQGSNPCLLCPLHWQVGSLELAAHGKPQSNK